MAGYEHQDDQVSKKTVLSVLVGVLVVIVGSVIWVLVSMDVWVEDRRPEGWERRPEPQPEDLAGVEMGLFDLTAPGLAAQHRQRERITSYGWVDRDREIVRIPIEEAMELYLEQRGQEAP